MAVSTNRPWRGALLAWLGMLALPTLLFAMGGPGDSDFSPGWQGRLEAMSIPVVFGSLPLALVSFGAFAPMGIAITRFLSSAGPWARALIGVGLAVPAFIAFVIATKVSQLLGLLGSKRSTLFEDFSHIAHRPSQAIPFLILLAVGGVIFTLTGRSAANASANQATE